MFRPTCDAKQLEFYEDRDPKSSKVDIQSIKMSNLQEDVHEESVSKGHLALGEDVDKHEDNLTVTESALDATSFDMFKHNFPNGMGLEEATAGDQVLSETKSIPTTNITMSVLEPNDSRNIHVRQEVCLVQLILTCQTIFFPFSFW